MRLKNEEDLKLKQEANFNISKEEFMKNKIRRNKIEEYKKGLLDQLHERSEKKKMLACYKKLQGKNSNILINDVWNEKERILKIEIYKKDLIKHLENQMVF